VTRAVVSLKERVGRVSVSTEPATSGARHRWISIDKGPGECSCEMNKKEIESPKLTANFLIWTTVFIVLLFALLAHFVWKVF
jgi:hypothetical protein